MEGSGTTAGAWILFRKCIFADNSMASTGIVSRNQYTGIVITLCPDPSSISPLPIPARVTPTGKQSLLRPTLGIWGDWGYLDSLRAVDQVQATKKPWRRSRSPWYRYGSDRRTLVIQFFLDGCGSTVESQ